MPPSLSFLSSRWAAKQTAARHEVARILLIAALHGTSLALAVIVLVILLSRFKYEMLWMTASFVDVMIIDPDAVRFLLTVIPGLYRDVVIVLALALPALALLWWIDPFRVGFATAAVGF